MRKENKPEWYERRWSVYRHIFPSGKVYIGQTWKNPEARWSGGIGYYGDSPMYKEIKLVGWENIKHEIILSGLRKYEADGLEKALIDEAVAKLGRGNVYNVQKVEAGKEFKDRPDYDLANRLVNYCIGKEIDNYMLNPETGWNCFTYSDFIRAAKRAGYSVKIIIEKGGDELVLENIKRS